MPGLSLKHTVAFPSAVPSLAHQSPGLTPKCQPLYSEVLRIYMTHFLLSSLQMRTLAFQVHH